MAAHVAKILPMLVASSSGKNPKGTCLLRTLGRRMAPKRGTWGSKMDIGYNTSANKSDDQSHALSGRKIAGRAVSYVEAIMNPPPQA